MSEASRVDLERVSIQIFRAWNHTNNSGQIEQMMGTVACEEKVKVQGSAHSGQIRV